MAATGTLVIPLEYGSTDTSPRQLSCCQKSQSLRDRKHKRSPLVSLRVRRKRESALCGQSPPQSPKSVSPFRSVSVSGLRRRSRRSRSRNSLLIARSTQDNGQSARFLGSVSVSENALPPLKPAATRSTTSEHLHSIDKLRHGTYLAWTRPPASPSSSSKPSTWQTRPLRETLRISGSPVVKRPHPSTYVKSLVTRELGSRYWEPCEYYGLS